MFQDTQLSKRPIALALATTLGLSLLASSALAQVPQDPIRLGLPSYNGTGCPAGSVSATVSPDNQELSILFGSFQVESGGISGKTVDRKACNVAIPVQVPQGFAVSMIRIDYRGYHRIPLHASGTFDVEYFFSGSTGPSYRKTFIGTSDGNFTLNNRVTAVSTVWSACGASVNLRTNTSIAVQTNSSYEQAMLTLDSADVSSGIVYQLQWKRCGQNGGGYDPQPTPYNPYPQPTPYNPYPQPQLGPCEVSNQFDHRGMQSFVVRDGYGRQIAQTVQYAEAVRQAHQAERYGSCRGIRNLVNQQPQQRHSCQVIGSQDARGYPIYRVLDSAGRILLTTRNHTEALRTQQSDQRCYR